MENPLSSPSPDPDGGASTSAPADKSEILGGPADWGRAGEVPTFRKWTDLGNAERFADHASGKLLWVYGMGWLHWDGTRWKRDEANMAMRLGAETVRSIYREAEACNRGAAKATDEAERKDLSEQAEGITKWARRSEQGSRMEALVRHGRGQKRLVLDGGVASLDADPNALNVANGILDLKTFELRKHAPGEYHTKIAVARYVKGARSEAWEGFVQRILPTEGVHRYVQKVMGSALRGRYSEDLLIPWGSGKNGKSTFLRAIRHALGDYAIEAAPEILVKKQGNRNAGDMSAVADLRGRRLITTIETAQGKQLDEQLVKQLTGESVLKAKYMRQDWIEFENQATIVLATNHKPKVQGADTAIWERLHLTPFTVYIPPEERDPELGAKLEEPEHQDAVLAWLVEGLRLFDEEGLEPPPEVLEATRDYHEEMDPLHDWMEGFATLDPNAVAPIAWVRNSYAGYCAAVGVPQVSANEFNESMVSRGLTKGQARVKGRTRKVWKGIALHDEWAYEAGERMAGGAGD